jgi:hypothetical protein
MNCYRVSRDIDFIVILLAAHGQRTSDRNSSVFVDNCSAISPFFTFRTILYITIHLAPKMMSESSLVSFNQLSDIGFSKH